MLLFLMKFNDASADKKVVSLIYTYIMPSLNPIWVRGGIFV